jgi:hypothetical protein
VNPFEAKGRRTKVERMLDQIDASIIFWRVDRVRHASQIADFLRRLDSKKWETIAKATDVPIPSSRTIAAVIERFEERAATMSQLKAEMRRTARKRRALTTRERTGTR